MSENLESGKKKIGKKTKQNKNNIKTVYIYGRADKGKSNFPPNIKLQKISSRLLYVYNNTFMFYYYT